MLLALLAAFAGTRVDDVAELDFFLARAMQYHLPHVVGQVFKGAVDVELVVLGQAFQHREVVAIAAVPALDGTAGQAQGRKCHDALRIKKFHVTEAVAGRAGANRRVERKQPWLHLAQ